MAFCSVKNPTTQLQYQSLGFWGFGVFVSTLLQDVQVNLTCYRMQPFQQSYRMQPFQLS